MAPPRAWSSTPPASRAREARPTLAVATVVLDSPRSIGRWIRHHVRIGALHVLLYANRATIDTVAAAATGTTREVVVGPLELVVAVRAQIVPEPAEVLRRGGGIAAWKTWKKLKPEEEVGPEVVLLVLLVLLVLEVDHVLGLGGQALVRFVDALERKVSERILALPLRRAGLLLLAGSLLLLVLLRL